MSAEDMVDAALAGFDQGEFVTIPALAGCGAMANLRSRAPGADAEFVSRETSRQVWRGPRRRLRPC